MIRTLLLLPGELRFQEWQDGLIVGLRYEKENNKRRITLSYGLRFENETNEDFNYSVRLTRTRCHFTGIRYWFVCPLLKKDGETPCRKRVAVLYKPPGKKYFGCRDCHNLTYESRSLTQFQRACKLFHFLEIKRQIEELSTKVYKGRRTRKYNALLKKSNKGLNYMQADANARLEKLSKK